MKALEGSQAHRGVENLPLGRNPFSPVLQNLSHAVKQQDILVSLVQARPLLSKLEKLLKFQFALELFQA